MGIGQNWMTAYFHLNKCNNAKLTLDWLCFPLWRDAKMTQIVDRFSLSDLLSITDRLESFAPCTSMLPSPLSQSEFGGIANKWLDAITCRFGFGRIYRVLGPSQALPGAKSAEIIPSTIVMPGWLCYKLFVFATLPQKHDCLIQGGWRWIAEQASCPSLCYCSVL